MAADSEDECRPCPVEASARQHARTTRNAHTTQHVRFLSLLHKWRTTHSLPAVLLHDPMAHDPIRWSCAAAAAAHDSDPMAHDPFARGRPRGPNFPSASCVNVAHPCQTYQKGKHANVHEHMHPSIQFKFHHAHHAHTYNKNENTYQRFPEDDPYRQKLA